MKAEAIDLVVMDCALSPVQQRNLEKAFGCKVIDRTGLILEIFGQRARTAEGALQVELAHLAYQRSRLVRSWTHLERQRGGFGFLGGPGETQIETDRRLIGERIIRIERELETVKRTRALHRASRSDVPYPIVALVGYTNAGKSTLFNRLTRAEVMAADMLFATLDPTMRLIRAAAWRLGDPLRHGRLHLRPADDADLRLPRHARGSARGRRHRACARHLPRSTAKRRAMTSRRSWTRLGVADRADRVIEVWNKVDRLDADARAALARGAGNEARRRRSPFPRGPGRGSTVSWRRSRIAWRAAAPDLELTLDASDGQGLHWLYEHAEVMSRRDEDDRLRLTVRVAPDQIERVKRRFALPGAVAPSGPGRTAGP